MNCFGLVGITWRVTCAVAKCFLLQFFQELYPPFNTQPPPPGFQANHIHIPFQGEPCTLPGTWTTTINWISSFGTMNRWIVGLSCAMSKYAKYCAPRPDMYSRWCMPTWWSRSFRKDLYGLAHVSGWEPYDLHPMCLAHVSWVGSLCSLCTDPA